MERCIGRLKHAWCKSARFSRRMDTTRSASISGGDRRSGGRGWRRSGRVLEHAIGRVRAARRYLARSPFARPVSSGRSPTNRQIIHSEPHSVPSRDVIDSWQTTVVRAGSRFASRIGACVHAELKNNRSGHPTFVGT